jgi:8-oxo-dGTP pyrophosphatase MutT (NUDIX family)
MASDRLILLRRGPVITMATEPWVPEGIDTAVVEAQWRSISESNSRCFDGRMLHVTGVHRNGHGGVTIHVADCAYRYYAVQTRGIDCGVRTLGAKAITRQGTRILLGKRAPWVMYYPGLWEFVPGGSVLPGQSPQETILEELQEETGCTAARPPIPIAVAYDPMAFSWEVIHDIELKPTSTPVGSMEYDALQWFDGGTLPDGLTPIAARMAALM